MCQVDLASVDNLECNAVCSGSHHPTCTAPALLHRYADTSSKVIIVDDNTRQALDIPGIVSGLVPLEQLGISSRAFIAMGTATYAVLSGFTIIVTGLIAVRLMQARRQHMSYFLDSLSRSIALRCIQKKVCAPSCA